ncbi:MAG: DUF99 family protein [Candidatus Nanohaloarchaea archaeon]
MKTGIRVLGIDDAAFSFNDEETFLTGVVYRGTEFIEDIRRIDVDVDGYDATEKVIGLYRKCNNPRQIKAVLTDGVSFAGFNIVDIVKVSEEIDTPVVAVTSNKPDRKRFRNAMERSGNYDEKFEKLGDFETLELKDGELYFQYSGCDRKDAEQMIKKSTIHGLTPEPVRVAHIIGQVFGSLE